MPYDMMNFNFYEIYTRLKGVIGGIVYVNNKKVEIFFCYDNFSFSTHNEGYIEELSPDDSDFAILIFKGVLLEKIGL